MSQALAVAQYYLGSLCLPMEHTLTSGPDGDQGTATGHLLPSPCFRYGWARDYTVQSPPRLGRCTGAHLPGPRSTLADLALSHTCNPAGRAVNRRPTAGPDAHPSHAKMAKAPATIRLFLQFPRVPPVCMAGLGGGARGVGRAHWAAITVVIVG